MMSFQLFMSAAVRGSADFWQRREVIKLPLHWAYRIIVSYKKDYGREQAEVIMNIVGNIISGQVTGDTAKQLSERIGKIMQQHDSVSLNSNGTSVSKSTQLDYAVLASKISGLSSGTFVGMVAGNPDEKVDLKVFHSEIQNDHASIKAEEDDYQPVLVIKMVSAFDIQEN